MNLSRKQLLTGLGVALGLALFYARVFPCPRGFESFLGVTLLGFLVFGALITAVQLLFTAPFRTGLRAASPHLLAAVVLLPLGLLGLPFLYIARMCG